jgi:hypothetical protein
MSVADQIIVHGHTKGTLMNSSGNVCLTGAALLDAGYDLNFDYLESDKADALRLAKMVDEELDK